jgi:hypothetical protein
VKVLQSMKAKMMQVMMQLRVDKQILLLRDPGKKQHMLEDLRICLGPQITLVHLQPMPPMCVVTTVMAVHSCTHFNA